MGCKEILSYHTYEEYKEQLDKELSKTAEGFVRIGYLLKVARDTDILKESGYATVTEFAQAEYGIDKTQVSRFIHINDRFSEGGYSDHLMQQYQGYGYAKLTLMLRLPDAVNESLSPAYSKAEIKSIKDEVDEEKKITDLEVLMEPADAAVDEDMIHKLIRHLGGNEPDLYVQMHKVLADESWTIENVKETMAPQGETTYSVRIPGTGRIMLMLNTESEEVQAVNIRTGEKESYGWRQLPSAWKAILDTEKDAEEKWSEIYCKEFPKVAPVQPEKKEEKAKKETKVKKAPKQTQLNDIDETAPKIVPPKTEDTLEKLDVDEKRNEEEPEQQLPGQMSVEDVPGITPETMEPGENADTNQRESTTRGYRAAVSNNLTTLKKIWEGTDENKITLMIDALNDLKWRLEQIQKIEKEREEEK